MIDLFFVFPLLWRNVYKTCSNSVVLISMILCKQTRHASPVHFAILNAQLMYYWEISHTSYSRLKKVQCFMNFVHSNKQSHNAVFENC